MAIRIESNMPHALKVPYPTGKGVPARFFEIPGAENGQPGVVEIEELDAISLERLKYHYEARPVDAKDPTAGEQKIGLLKITITDGPPKGGRGVARKIANEQGGGAAANP